MSTLEATGTHKEGTFPTSVDIELLALDLSACTRCTGSLESVEAAVALTKPALDAAGFQVRVHERVIETEEQARRHRFFASPTIRVDGLDIAPDLRESRCDSCTDLCGCDEGTTCREWRYRGETHDTAPVGLIVEALMGAAFGKRARELSSTNRGEISEGVPDNLKRFFAGTSAATPAAPCCEPATQETCCGPAEKSSCCGAGEKTCGCQ